MSKPENQKDFASAMSKTGEETGFAQAAADLVRSNASKRVAAVGSDQIAEQARARVSGVILMPETKDTFQSAEKLLEKVRAANTAKQEQHAANNQKYLYYVRCINSHVPDATGNTPPQHGVYLAKHPGELPVGPNGWYATYKGVDDLKYRGDILCQVCLDAGASGGAVPLPIVWTDARKGEWRPERRHLWRWDRDTGEESRASLLPYEAANPQPVTAPALAKAV